MNPSSESMDNYAYEIEQEKIAESKGMHQPMKRWYNYNNGYLIEKWGDFPLFWQDLDNWPPYREVKKAYLMHVEGIKVNLQEYSEQMNESNGVKIDSSDLEKNVEDSGLTENNEGNDFTSAKESTTVSEQEEQESEDGQGKKRKNRWGETKKSRWGGKLVTNNNSVSNILPGQKVPRRSRWSEEGAVKITEPTTPAPTLGMAPTLSQEQIQEFLVLQMRLQQVNERLVTVVQDAIRREQDPDKTPSPPPRYDADGKRVNTREVRMREALETERGNVIESMLKLNPLFQAPPDYVRRKPFRRLYIPQREYPGYNFIGLIIGPRGNTQKRMERETGCKIAIRGRGSVKEGARRTLVKTVDEEDDLHVFVQGDTEEQVEKAAAEISALLRPVDDELNEHKQRQLRELALINGTLRDDEFCHICGEKGHRQFECPKRVAQRPGVEVRCGICGDASHPTRDCRLVANGANDASKAAALDTEYLNFMAELGDKSAQSQQQLQHQGGKESDQSTTSIPHKVYTPPSSSAAKDIPHIVYQPPTMPTLAATMPPVPAFPSSFAPPAINPFATVPQASMPGYPMQYHVSPTTLGLTGTVPPLYQPYISPFGAALPFHSNMVPNEMEKKMNSTEVLMPSYQSFYGAEFQPLSAEDKSGNTSMPPPLPVPVTSDATIQPPLPPSQPPLPPS